MSTLSDTTVRAPEEPRPRPAPEAALHPERSGRLGPGLSRHGLPSVVFVLVAVWLCHRFLFSSQLPAGTDMLGFISRAQQNASWSQLLNTWDPQSLGSTRTINLDNVLGLLTLLVRSPFVLLKALDFLVLVATAVSAYALAWSLSQRRRVATIAGLLFMCSQSSLSLRGVGHFNVAIVAAVTPLLVLAWIRCMTDFSWSRVLVFALLSAGVILVRIDLILYVMPFFLLYVVVAAVASPQPSRVVREAAKAVVATGVALTAVGLYWIIPTLAGIHSGYVTLGSLFDPNALRIRSLGLYPSLLGFAREIGYFLFSGQQTWDYHPWMPLWTYYAVATVVPLLAFTALRWYRNASALFLALAAVIASLLAPGIRPPLGSGYLFVIHHIPVLGDLRDPTRWLVIQALAYAVLAALAIDKLADMAAARWQRRRVLVRTRALSLGLPLVVVLVGLLGVGPTLTTGLLAWSPTPAQFALLSATRTAPSPGLVATIPYDESYAYVTDGSYQGWEHSLGLESVLYTGRRVLGTGGGWNQRTADFTNFTASLLANGDPAFGRLLANAGVSSLLSLNQPLSEPQFLALDRGSYFQQAEASHAAGLTPATTNGAGTLYSIAGTQSPFNVKFDSAVVLGGDEGLAELADLKGIDFTDWATLTASDALSAGGIAQLGREIDSSNLVEVADERLLDVAILGTPAVMDMVGITSDPQLARLSENLISDRSLQQGALTNESLPAPQPQSTSNTQAFSLATATTVDAWAHVRYSPDAARIDLDVDGRRLGQVTPLALDSGGFSWVDLGQVKLPAGAHDVTVSAAATTWGDDYEVDEVRLLEPKAAGASVARLDADVSAAADRTLYAFDLSSALTWSTFGRLGLVAPAQPSVTHGYWKAESLTRSASLTSPGGTPVPEFAYAATPERFHALVYHTGPAADWRNRPYLYLTYYTSGSAQPYQLVLGSGGSAAGQSATFLLSGTPGWHSVALAESAAGDVGASFSWSDVSLLRVATVSKIESGTIALSDVSVSAEVSSAVLSMPVRPAATARRVVLGPKCNGVVAPAVVNPGARALVLRSPLAELATCRAYVLAPRMPRQYAPVAVTARQTGAESFELSARLPRPGVLVVPEAYDPLWHLSTGGTTVLPSPVLSLVDGYRVPAGSFSGALAFDGESSTRLAVVLSLVALVLIVVGTVLLSRRRRRRGGRAVTPAQPSLVTPPAGGQRSAPGRSIGTLELLAVATLAAASAIGLIVLGPSGLHDVSLALFIAAGAYLAARARLELVGALGLALVVACPILQLVGEAGSIGNVAAAALLTLGIAACRLVVRARRDVVASTQRMAAPPARGGDGSTVAAGRPSGS